MTSIPALPNVLNRSSSSSDDVISDGRSSLTSSYSRYPFSLPILISCRTSSYFSSIDIHHPRTVLIESPDLPPAPDGISGYKGSGRHSTEFFDTVEQIFLF